MKMFKLKIKSDAQAGRCVGMRFGGGLVTYPDVQMNPPVNAPALSMVYAHRKAGVRVSLKVQ